MFGSLLTDKQYDEHVSAHTLLCLTRMGIVREPLNLINFPQ